MFKNKFAFKLSNANKIIFLILGGAILGGGFYFLYRYTMTA